MSCFNLSGKIQSIHDSIQEIKGVMKELKQGTGDWLENIFKDRGLPGGMSFSCKEFLLVVLAIILIYIAFRTLQGVITKCNKRNNCPLPTLLWPPSKDGGRGQRQQCQELVSSLPPFKTKQNRGRCGGGFLISNSPYGLFLLSTRCLVLSQVFPSPALLSLTSVSPLCPWKTVPLITQFKGRHGTLFTLSLAPPLENKDL